MSSKYRGGRRCANVFDLGRAKPGRGCRRLFPRIDDLRAREVVIARVAGDDGQSMVEGGRGDDEIGLREGVAGLAAFFDMRRHLSMMSSLIGMTRPSNMGRILFASHSVNSARLPASATSSIPKRISAKVAALTWSRSRGFAFTKATTFGSGFGLRSSESAVVSSSQPFTARPRASAWARGAAQCRYRDGATPASRRSAPRRCARL